MSVVIKANPTALIRYGASFASQTTLAANGSVQVFAPASNTAGAIVWDARMASQAVSGWPGIALIAKSGSAPASFADGSVLLSADSQFNNGVSSGESASLGMPVFVPPGQGLWFFAANAENAGSARRSCLYTLL